MSTSESKISAISVASLILPAAFLISLAFVIFIREHGPAEVLPVFRPLSTQQEKLSLQAKLSTLDYAPPDFKALIEMLLVPEKGKDYTTFIQYFEKVKSAFPQKAESYGILGILYYYDGQTEEAVKNLTKAQELNKDLFYSCFNLAAVYFNGRQYDQAIVYAQKALSASAEESIKTVATSLIYRKFLNISPQEAAKRIAQARQETIWLMGVSLQKTGRQDALVHFLNTTKLTPKDLGKNRVVILKAF